MDSNESPPTYEATLEHHGIMPAQMQRQCSDEIISAVAPRMNDWRAIVLGVDKGKIDAIEKDTTDEEGKRRKFLECWKQKLGHRATCELLTRSFIQSGRADLADAVCLELQWKTVTTDGLQMSKLRKETGIPQVPRSEYKMFTISPSEEETTNRGTPSLTADVETAGSSLRQRKRGNFDVNLKEERTSLNMSPQGIPEESDGEQSKMVASSTDSIPAKHETIPSTPATPHSTPGHLPSTRTWAASHIDNLILLLMREKDEKFQMQIDFQKRSKIAQLEGRQGKVSTYLKEKQEKVERQDGEVQQLHCTLDKERREKDVVQQELEKNKRKIAHLENSNYQRDVELKKVKEDQQENLAQLREKLEKSQGELKSEKTSKEEKLSRATKRIEHLQNDVENAQKELNTTRMEQEKIENVLKWMEEDLNEERKEEDTLLKCKLQKYRKLTRAYRCMLLIVILVLFCLVLSHIPFSYLCTSISKY